MAQFIQIDKQTPVSYRRRDLNTRPPPPSPKTVPLDDGTSRASTVTALYRSPA